MERVSNAQFVRESLIGVRKWCKAICAALFVVAAVFAISCMAALPFILFDAVTAGSGDAILAAVFVFLRGGMVVAALMIMAYVFNDASSCGTPFSLRQTKRLRMIGLLLVCLVLLEVAFDFNYAAYLDMFGMPVEYTVDASRALNVPALTLAAVAFCMSVIFEYGELLQYDEDMLV